MDILINCIRKNLGFFNGRPIAACVVYRCLLQWKSFEAERTDHFDRIMTCMHSAVYVSST
jgi:myosin-5